MATDFTDWAVGDMVLTLDGREYRSRPPSVDQSRVLLAVFAHFEVEHGLAKGPVPDDLAELYETVAQAPLAEVSLGATVREQMIADGLPPETIRRMGVYGVLFWMRGKEYADTLAAMLWRREDEEAAADAPKGRRAWRSGRNTA